MIKQKLNTDTVENRAISFIEDSGFNDFHRCRQQLLCYFSKNKLDDAILNHLYGVFLVAPGNKGLSFYKEMTIHHYLGIIEKAFSPDDDISLSLRSLFKGVNKRLTLPLLLMKEGTIDDDARKLTDPDNMLSLEDSLCRSITFAYANDQVAKVNPKNLVKHCGWPLIDAKALFRNMSNLGGFAYIAKDNRPSAHINRVAVCSQQTPALRCWQLDNVSLLQQFIEQTDEDISTDDLSALMSKNALPITDLQIWRSITKEWYEATHDFPWAKLSLQAQKRHLVNMIRHGSIGYSQAYSSVPPRLSEILHEAAFDAIMKKIANTFPFLRTECQRQWAYRDANNIHWDALVD